MRQVAELQERAGAWRDHLLPLVQQIASRDVGGILLGAFDGSAVVAFVYGFPGTYQGRSVLHSHMLTVDPRYRGRDLGYRLKVAQRSEALARGVREITWTFDPLRSANAYLNVTRLGVVAVDYRVNYYGSDSSAPGALHIGTDRIWVQWLLDSERVVRRLRGGIPPVLLRPEAFALVRRGRGKKPDVSFPDSGEAVLAIEIPHEISTLQRSDPAAAKTWRECTRAAFVDCFARGYRLEEFVRTGAGEPAAEESGSYLFEKPGLAATSAGVGEHLP
ncbi:MAG TPA: GNAT family N-acetyltransferase [Thermoanaerobaculia bacterium]|nr:GNAT family N-acetyltransferase [Thermoanaerobaculia bacterium]